MATVREYFDTDLNRDLTVHKPWTLRDESGRELASVIARISQAFQANAKFWSFYFPEGLNPLATSRAVLEMPETSRCVLGAEGDTFNVLSGNAGYSEMMSSTSLVFTKRVFLYIDEFLSTDDRAWITSLGKSLNLEVVVRDREYAKKRSAMEKPLAFISHDSRDKDGLVRELAGALIKRMCPVWYDEYSLEVGASLRASIEKGLKETEKCILILSPHYLSNEGWGKAEFDSVFTREILERKNVILPVWHNVTAEQVYEYSPRLADRVGLQSSIGVEKLAGKLFRAIINADT